MKKLKDGWKNIHLKDILSDDIRNGYSPLPAENETGYWVLGLGALTDNGLNKDEIKPVHFEERVEKSLLKFGDFLVSRSNTPDKVGRSILFKNEIINCSYPDLMMRFRINETLAYPYFIEQYLKTKSIRAYFSNSASGSSKSMVKINKSILEKTPLLLPPLEEQIQIAETLSTWDNAIQATEKLIENSRQQKKALMQVLLNGKKRLSGFAGEWKKVKLGTLIQEIKKAKAQNPKQLELLTVKLHYKGTIPTGKKPNATEKGRTYYKRLKGELIVGRQNLHNGGIAIVDEKCDGLIASNAISSFSALEFTDIVFVLNIMSTPYFRNYVDSLTGGTGQKEISVKEILNIPVLVPELLEQQKIAEILSTADQEIEALQRKLECLKLEKGALMQRLLG